MVAGILGNNARYLRGQARESMSDDGWHHIKGIGGAGSNIFVYRASALVDRGLREEANASLKEVDCTQDQSPGSPHRERPRPILSESQSPLLFPPAYCHNCEK